MRRKLQELKEALRGFVDQHDHLLLVVSGGDAELAWILKTLQGLDDEIPSDLFLLFPQEEMSAPRYVTALLAALEAQLVGVNAARLERQEPPWPLLPAACKDFQAEPGLRLRAAMEHVREWVPREGDHRIIWGLLPLQLKDPVGYARLVAQLLPVEGFQPWMRSLRIIVRDDKDAPFLVPVLRKRKVPGVLLYEPDMSTAALTNSLAQDAEDPTLPTAERMQALLQVAALDYSYKRYAQAAEKYALLHAYYAGQGVPQVQALCLQGSGDVLRQMGRLPAAKERYQQGLAVAARSQALPVILNLALAAGDTCLELQQYVEAEGYFDIADRVAAKALNPYPKADALEKMGLARQGRGNLGGAVASWREAATLCRAVEYPARLRGVLERLANVYQQAGMKQQLRECQAELRTLTKEHLP